MPLERLQKIIAHAGVTSRRKAEELIAAGRVTVNGKVVTELGAKADALRDSITVDHRPLGRAEQPLYLMLYKPRGVVSTLSDPEGRPTVADFIRGSRLRLYPVGRLDYASEGLLLLTNDGELAHRILHARTRLPKVYVVKTGGRAEEPQLERLRRGISLDGRRTAPAEIRWLRRADAARYGIARPSDENPWLEVTLIEGRQNQIRRMFDSIGRHVEKLKRVRIGPIELGGLKPGMLRELTAAEVGKLKRATGIGSEAGAGAAQPARRPFAAAAGGERAPGRKSGPAARPTGERWARARRPVRVRRER
jgi:23S rRNA pseudouridine2605 synthase